MEDISSLIWLGIAIVWLITRLVRSGVKKAARARQSETPRRQPAATTSRASTPQMENQGNRFGPPPTRTGRDSTVPPPIVPR